MSELLCALAIHDPRFPPHRGSCSNFSIARSFSRRNWWPNGPQSANSGRRPGWARQDQTRPNGSAILPVYSRYLVPATDAPDFHRSPPFLSTAGMIRMLPSPWSKMVKSFFRASCAKSASGESLVGSR